MLVTSPSAPTPAEIIRDIKELREQVELFTKRLVKSVTLEDRQDAKRDIEIAQCAIAKLKRKLLHTGFERRS